MTDLFEFSRRTPFETGIALGPGDSISICQHSWLLTGRQGVHVEFPTKIKGKKSLFVIYVRCKACGQDGFFRPGRSEVIYTWDKRPENWIMA